MTSQRQWTPLTAEEVTAALERRNPPRIPMVRSKWWGDGLDEHYGAALSRFDRFPEDAVSVMLQPVIPSQMGLSWKIHDDGAHDSRTVIEAWEQLDEFAEKLPDPEGDPQFEPLIQLAEAAHRDDRYVLFGWWRLFFEFPWGLRGMTNLLVDFHTDPEQVARLQQILTDHYLRYLRVAVRELKPHGFWTSDDLGHQENLFMSPDTFRALIKPYYAQIGAFLQHRKMHWWLHSCGHNTPILDDLVEVGVTIFHPVQKGTMDEAAVAREFGDRLNFLVGFDVQHILPEGSPDQIRAEVRHLIDTFDRADGGMCMAAGNGILPDTPLANIEAYLDEAYTYGTRHRSLHRDPARL